MRRGNLSHWGNFLSTTARYIFSIVIHSIPIYWRFQGAFSSQGKTRQRNQLILQFPRWSIVPIYPLHLTLLTTALPSLATSGIWLLRILILTVWASTED